MSGRRPPWGHFPSPPRSSESPLDQGRWNPNVRRSPSPRSLSGQSWQRRPVSPRELSGSWINPGSRPREYGNDNFREGSPRGEFRGRSPRRLSPSRSRERSPAFRGRSPLRRDFSPRAQRSSPPMDFRPLSPHRVRQGSPPTVFRTQGFPIGMRNHVSPDISRGRSPPFRSPGERFRPISPRVRERSPRMAYRSPSPGERYRGRNMSPEFQRRSQPSFASSRDLSPQNDYRKISPPRATNISSLRSLREGSPTFGAPEFRRSPVDKFEQRISKASIDPRRFDGDFQAENPRVEMLLGGPKIGHPSMLPLVRKGRIKEYINDFSGILEVIETEERNQVPTCVFFHASCVWIPERKYGQPVKFLDVLGPNTVPSENTIRLERELEIGSSVYFQSFTAFDQSHLQRVALSVCPYSLNKHPDLEDPNHLGSQEVRQKQYFLEFTNRVVEAKSSNKLVQATFPIFPWRGCNSDFEAQVILLEDDFGILRLSGTNNLKPIPERFSFNCLFHKDRVWNEKEQRICDIKEMKSRSLKEILKVDETVTVSARSITNSSGADLRKAQLELQAIVVSKIPKRIPFSAPKPTHCKEGTGTYAMESFSWYYFNQNLHNSLNIELLAYMEKSSRGNLSGIRADLLQVNNTVNMKFKKKLSRAHGRVCNALGRKAVIIESYDKTWRCLVVPERSLHFNTSGKLFHEASLVFVNASLIDPAASVQYIATAAWEISMDPPLQSMVANTDTPINQSLRDLYDSVVSTVPNTSFASDLNMPNFIECEEGEIVKIISNTYGIFKYSDHLVIFYNDDMLSESDKFQKGSEFLSELARNRAKVVFNACLVDKLLPIPYLATRCFLKRDTDLDPMGKLRKIARVQLDENKSRSIRLALASFFESVEPTPRESVILDLMPSVDGVIRCIFRDAKCKDYNHIFGGLIQGKGGSVIFFLTKFSLVLSEIPKISKKVKMNVKPIRDSHSIVQGFALTIFEMGDVKEAENEAEDKYRTYIEKWRQLLSLSSVREACTLLKSGQSPPGMVDLTAFDYQGSAKTFQPFIDVTDAKLKYMINETSGVLEAPDKSLCYFEKEDLNIKSKVSMEDLAAVMSVTQINFQAKLFNDKGTIQYVANAKGVQIVSDPPFSMQHIFLDTGCPTSSTPTGLQSEKYRRYRNADDICRDGKAIPVSDILDKSYLSREDIVEKVGKIKCILNENFGVIYGPFDKGTKQQKKFALFDKFDFFTSGSLTLADENKSLVEIAKLDMEVTYNACLIDKSMAVPYLVTGCWPLSREDPNPPRRPYQRSEIYEGKIKVYTQVAEECEPTFRKPVDAALNVSKETKEGDIKAVYQSSHYQHYSQIVPRRERSSRDPKTPDFHEAFSPQEWKLRMFEWKDNLANFVEKNPEPIKFDLKDTSSTCSLGEIIDQTFAIMKTSNGEKVLLHHDRVWLNNKPLFRGWEGIQKSPFKVLNLNAIRWDDGPSSIKYQAVFCHAGVRLRNSSTKDFDYPSGMEKWIQQKYADLDKEAEIFIKTSKVHRSFRGR